MSRSLDHDAAASIQLGSHQIVYKDVVGALRLPEETSDLLEIELLGPSHQLPAGCNFLRDGNSIAIPKIKLVQAFIFARQILFKFLKDFWVEKHQDLADASAVILLMDPEHLTAANARKKLVNTYQCRSSEEFKVALTKELCFIDSMLTSPLHRHSKSPTLWSHRRWILQVCQSVQMLYDIQRDFTAVVLISAQRHPRNYYSWSHMRWLLSGNTSHGSRRSLNKAVAFDYSKMLSTAKDWCLRHPADTSGWSFLIFSLFCIEPSEGVIETVTRIHAKSAICREVLDLAVSFHWTHESVWVFLRTLIASGEVMEEQRKYFLNTVEGILSAPTAGFETKSTVQAAHDWCINNERAQ